MIISYKHDKPNKFGEFLKSLNSKVKENECIELEIPKKLKVYLGIFFYYGFKIINVTQDNYKVHFKVKKTKCVDENCCDKRYSILIKLPRTGKNGKRIYVYKFRTMQPYSEYLQDYVIECNGLNSDGTIRNDFRITKWGKFLRRYWLDELPMLINFFKGDLKLIGVRPLSDSMLSKYPKEFVSFRNQFKPGLIPPYYIDKPKTFEELIESEERYLFKSQQSPIKTDIIYFLKFLKAAILKGVRSS